MKQLMAGIVDINDVDESGCTALYWAVHKGAVDCVRVLLESKADVNKANDDQLTPIHKACWNGDVECVKLLVAHKANVNARAVYGVSALHYVAKRGHRECAEILVRVGAEVDARDDEDNTPLANSIDESEHDCAEFLFDAGAKISIVCEAVAIPDWMEGIVEKRRHVKRGLLSFLGVLRKRFVVVRGGGTEHIGGRLPRDLVGVLRSYVWRTRFDERWALATYEVKK